MNGALVPKNVIPTRSARSQSRPGSGHIGLPSKQTIVVPASSPPTRKFHIIQPVVENQKNRSPGPRSQCNRSEERCSSTIPPCPWTIALGGPAFPDEYRIH